jgi:hypothetical protein
MSRRGQILPLFALMLVALLAIAALAIDVSGVLAARQFYRTAADAAALAGGQDLQDQVNGTRGVGASQYNSARSDAKASLEHQFGGAATCSLTGNRYNCTFAGTTMTATIITPIPASACATCDPARSVQVNVVNPQYQLSFARVLGFGSFQVEEIGVAGLFFGHAYTIVTLRPPAAATIPGVRDITVNGGSSVVVTNGDVGTNANMIYGGVTPPTEMYLDSGYNAYYYDPYLAPQWGGVNPPGVRIYSLIPDPSYPIPSRTNAPVGSTDTTGCASIAADVYANSDYAPSVPVTGTPPAPDMSKITCYTKGIYASQVTVNNGNLGIFEPGVYFFDGGLNAQGSVIGGYTPSSPGVAFVFPETMGTMFKNRTSGGGSSLKQLVAINAGTRYSKTGGANAGGHEATAAEDFSGGLVQTNTSPAHLMSVIVPPDSKCWVSLTTFTTCTNLEEGKNKSIDLSGGSALYLAGVQYAPSDNVSLAGNTTTGGYVGQVWAWTLVYTGSSQINQEGEQTAKPGTLRLDAACTAPGTPCVP